MTKEQLVAAARSEYFVADSGIYEHMLYELALLPFRSFESDGGGRQ